MLKLRNIVTFLLKQKKKKIAWLFLGISFLLFLFILPDPLFDTPYSMVIEDRNQNLLGAHIADDEQWRFPITDSISDEFEKSILTFEDKRFFYHPGFDPLAFARAIWLNIKAKKIVSGGSTLSMQVIRLSRKNTNRTVGEKIIEIILALRLELTFSKPEILRLYASQAPFGGNIVGIEAASWRYFGLKPRQLSWAQNALLAVLPNSPSLIHPGKNRKRLFEKRNNLLHKLHQNRTIDSETLELALSESLPDKPKAFPQLAQHILMKIRQKQISKKKVITTLDIEIQRQVNRIVEKHHERLTMNGINNLAAIVIEVETNNILAYVGNVNSTSDENGNMVDVLTAERSTGSILKPFLYAAMLTSGDILPNSLIADIPIQLGGYSPKNYAMGYDGAVPASRALARSLNVPAVRMLAKYGVPKFHFLLNKIGMTTITQAPDYYGLSLILGGCEGKLEEIAGVYAGMARTLLHYQSYSGKYNKSDYYLPNIDSPKNKEKNINLEEASWFSAAAIWHTFQAMVEVERPDAENMWEYFDGSQRIAWKTGTSFGFRDAWAIGLTPKYVVGVWAGNADGEGRPSLIGVQAAAPVLFDIFDLLPKSDDWFQMPYDDLIKVNICAKSGYLASEICDEIDSAWIPSTGLRFDVCPYHKWIHLDPSATYRVTDRCLSPSKMLHVPWFVLPPAMEWFYKTKNADYISLPPYMENCSPLEEDLKLSNMQIIYPHHNLRIFVPVEIDGKKGSTVFEVTHRVANSTIFWYMDELFLGETQNIHKLELSPVKGKHILTLVDENGEKISRIFEIIDGNN